MKKMLVISIALMMIFSVGFAFASESRTPQYVQDFFTTQGVKANFNMWFPTVPQMSNVGWSNTLILSNFADSPITIFVWFTTFSSVQTMKTYQLSSYQKKIITLGGSSGFGDDLYDIYCGSDKFFGAAVLLLENGNVAAAWPPIIW
ncbi:MAG: hypothetical protein V2B19_31025 [Pseudomonadota bacterium]